MKKSLLLALLIAFLGISCTNQGDIKPKAKLHELKMADSLETVNETAMCFDAHRKDGTLVIDSLKPVRILDSTPYSAVVIPCKGYNGMWHSHPDVVKMSEMDADYLKRNSVDYMMISVDGDFGAWHKSEIFENDENRIFPTYFFTFKK